MKYIIFFFFFFSSRRRHTRCYRDWSSDVCSSDLIAVPDVRWVVTMKVDEEEISLLSQIIFDFGTERNREREFPIHARSSPVFENCACCRVFCYVAARPALAPDARSKTRSRAGQTLVIRFALGGEFISPEGINLSTSLNAEFQRVRPILQ